MIVEFDGWLFPPQGSNRRAIHLAVDETGQVHISDAQTNGRIMTVVWRDLTVSSRIGNTPRRLTLPDGQVIETEDNDAVDRVEKKFRGTTRGELVHRMERLTLFTVIVLVVLGAVTYGIIGYGLPWTAEKVAFALPEDVLDGLADDGVELMDRLYFKPTELAEEDQQKFRAELDRILSVSNLDPDCCTLLFRDGDKVGANAFALPDGTIFLTDQLVALAEDDREVIGVLAHEVSHVEFRHSLRGILQSSALSMIVIFITGDLGQVSELAIAIPVLFAELGYSRGFEREADARASELLTALEIDPVYLATMFQRLAEECGDNCGPGWLSTHPSPDDRAKALRPPTSESDE